MYDIVNSYFDFINLIITHAILTSSFDCPSVKDRGATPKQYIY